jgi:hypothetical protein
MNKLRILTTFLILPVFGLPATRTVCASGCDHAATIAGLQAAHDAASCGDEIVITAGTEFTATDTQKVTINKQCSAGSEIIFRSSTSTDWLPAAEQRTLPTFAPLGWKITTTGNRSNEPVIDQRTNGTSGVIIRDLRVHVGSGTTNQFAIIAAGPWNGTASSQLADRIRYDRLMFTTDFQAGIVTKTLLYWFTKKAEVYGSYAVDLGCYSATSGDECYPQLAHNQSVGPFSSKYNYWAGGFSIGFISGGQSDHNYPAEQVQPNGFDIQHNVYTIWDRYAPSALFGPGRMIKNCDERKVGNDTFFAFNTCEGFDRISGGGQSFGATYTLRQAANPLAGTASLNGGRDQISITITGSPSVWPVVGYYAAYCTRGPGACTAYPETGWEFRPITNVTGNCSSRLTGSCTITVSPAFSSAVDTNNQAGVNAMPWATIHRTTYTNNVVRNTSNLFLTLGRDEMGIAAQFPNARVIGLTFQNNLLDVRRNPAYNGSPGMMGQIKARHTSTVLRKNSLYFASTLTSRPWGGGFYAQCKSEFLAAEDDWCESTKIEGNIYPTGEYNSPIASDAMTPQNTMNQRNDTGLVYKYNMLHAPLGSGFSEPFRSLVESCTGGRLCSNNFFPTDPTGVVPETFKAPSSNDFRVSQSQLRGAMDDGTDVGADISLLPLIRYVTVTPATTSAVIAYDVPNYWADRACSVEVAAAGTGLIDDSANFAIINAQRADWFKRAPYDLEQVARGWTTVKGRRRFFTVGSSSATVTDDNSQTRDIRLTTGTSYDYRIMCGGAVHRGTFTTL